MNVALGRMLVIAGVVIAVAGVLLMFGDRLPIRFGRLPGDVVWKGRNTTVYFPIVTSLLLSVLLTLVMWILNRR